MYDCIHSHVPVRNTITSFRLQPQDTVISFPTPVPQPPPSQFLQPLPSRFPQPPPLPASPQPPPLPESLCSSAASRRWRRPDPFMWRLLLAPGRPACYQWAPSRGGYRTRGYRRAAPTKQNAVTLENAVRFCVQHIYHSVGRL